MAEDKRGWVEERSRTVRSDDPTTAMFDGEPMSGLDQARAMLNGDLPAAPIAQLLGMRMTDVSPGSATFTLEPHQSHENGVGVVNGGVLATLLDMAVACAVMSTLPAGHRFTSIDLSVSMLRAAGADSGTLTCVGTVVKPGRQVSFTEAKVTDSKGRLVATATSSLLIISPAGPAETGRTQ